MSFEPQLVYGERPPNFEQIVAVFPLARRMSVVFAYGDKIYIPSGEPLEPKLLAHEYIHCKRQVELGLDEWWKRYLTDPVFRYYEEMLAHRAEYKYLECHAKSRNERRFALKLTAQRLTAPLYEYRVSLSQAKEDLTRNG